MMQENQHIVSAFDKELLAIKRLITEMAGIVEQQIEESVKAIITRDRDLSEKVIETDRRVDQLEEELDHLVIKVVALRHPKARDLRESLGVMKVASNLERMGDYAKNISKRNRVLVASPPINSSSNTLKRMGQMVREMIDNVIVAYQKGDAAQAENVRLQDEDVDLLHNTLFRELLTYMMEDPRAITPSMHLLFIAKNIERIGDHITAIAEQVIYIETGNKPDEPRPKSDKTAYIEIKPESDEQR